MNSTDDWYDVAKTGQKRYRILEAGRYGSYLIEGADRALLVDTGIGIGDLRTLVDDLVDRPVTVLLSHTHWDHIGNAAAFEDVRASPAEIAPDGTIRIDTVTDEFLHRPAEFVDEWRADGNAFPDGFDPDSYGVEPASASGVDLESGIDLGDRTIELLATPGHSPGHLAALDRESDVLYGGDVLHYDRGLYAHFEGADLEAYRDTFDRLVRLREEGAFSVLLTSHNEPIEEEELSILDEMRDGLDRVRNGSLDYETVETSWGTMREYTIAGSPVLTSPNRRNRE